MVHPIAGTRPRGATPQEDHGPRRGAARRPQGARRAPDARRPRPQRPGPGLRAGQRRGRRLHVHRALLPRHAHRLDGDRPGRRGPHRLRRPDRLLPRRHPLRRAQAPRDADHRGAGAHPPRRCTAAASATSTSPGDSDTAIAIRTALLRDGTAYVQAGAGVVADSDPVAEDTECRNKAAAVLRAVHTANRLAVRVGRLTHVSPGDGARGQAIVGYVTAVPVPQPRAEAAGPRRGRPPQPRRSPCSCGALGAAVVAARLRPDWAEGTRRRRRRRAAR